MSAPVGANGQDFAYPVDQEVGYAAEATGWAEAVTAALNSIGRGDSSNVNPKAVIDMVSTTKGFLVPRMTTAQIAAIASPPEALMLYDTDLRVFKYRRNGVWVSLGSFVEGDLDVNGNLDVSGTGIFGSSLSALSLAITNAITAASVTLTGALNAASVTLTGAFQALTGNFTDATDAADVDTAPLKTLGGMAVKKKLFVGTDANIGGDANVIGKIITGNGTASLPSHSFISDPNTGLYRISDGVMGFVSNGIKRGEFGGSYGGFTGNLIQLNSFTQNFQTIITTVTFSNINSSSGVIWEISITPKLANSKIFILYKFGIAINLEYGGIKILNKINAGGTYSTIYDPQKTGNDQNGLEFGVQSSASYQLVNIPIIHSPVYNVGDTLFYKAMGSVYSAGQSLVINTLRTGTGANSGHSEAYILEIANI
jgi:hypothetical protein